MADMTYLEQKRKEVLKEIEPICKAFNIQDYDYIIKDGREVLKIYNTYIGCKGNSISAIIDELIGWIFVKIYCKNRSIGAFEKQTLNVVKRYWIEKR